MLHLLYISAFTILAVIAVANLIRNLIMFGFEQEPARTRTTPGSGYPASRRVNVPHPELLDEMGNVIREPLLVMRSVNVEDARQQLDALYESSPSYHSEKREEG